MYYFYKPLKPGKCSAQQHVFFYMFGSTVLIGESFDVRLREGASGERMCVLCNPQIKRGKNSIDSSAEDIHLMSFTGEKRPMSQAAE